MSALVNGLTLPKHLLQEGASKQGGEFDPNQYFTALPHLSMERGYLLDYVYFYGGLGAQPLLYARPAEQPPYATFAAYAEALGSDPFQQRSAYLDHVRTDGTPEGFFQLVVLRIMGEQFYLYWHAHYNDATILCSRGALEALIVQLQEAKLGLELPADAQQQARALDPTPVVEIAEGTVSVQVLVFSRWAGFSQESYSFSRSFPHRLLQADRRIVVPYDCGIRF